MPGACRVILDLVGINGRVISGTCDVLINGYPAATVTNIVIPHAPYKGLHAKPSPVLNGTCSVLVGGKPIATQFVSRSACGDVFLTGSCDVLVG